MRNIDYLRQQGTSKKTRSFIHAQEHKNRIINKIHNLRNNKKVVKKLGTKIKGFKTGIYRV